MITPNKKYKVFKDVPGVAYEGQIVVPEPGDDEGLRRGKTGMILCKIDPAGSLFFHEDNLVPVE